MQNDAKLLIYWESLLAFLRKLAYLCNIDNAILPNQQHYESIYMLEEAMEDVELDYSMDELVIRVGRCPAVAHINKSGGSLSPLFYETTKMVNETICEETPFAFELLEYKHGTGASVQRFYRKGCGI